MKKIRHIKDFPGAACGFPTRFYKATIKTGFDSVPAKMKIVLQDTGWVISNLVAMAIATVTEKSKRQRLIKHLLHTLFWVCLFFPLVVNSQSRSLTATQNTLDSLKGILVELPDGDSAVVNLKQITQLYFTGIYQLDSARKYGTLLYELGQRIENEKGIALGQYYLGRVADGKGDYVTATNYLKAFLESDVVRHDTLLLASGLYSMANICIHQGDLEEALNYQLQVLRLDEASGDSSTIGLSLNNLGIIMKELNRSQEAIEYLERAKSIFENLGDEANVAMALSNLGGLYANEGDNVKALNVFRRSLDIYERLNHERGIALALEHIGMVEGKMGEFEKSLNNHHRSLAIKKKLELKKEMAESFHQIALIHNTMHHTDSARYYFTLGLDIAEDIGDKKGIRRAYKELADLEAGNHNFKKAYEFFVSYHRISDSILNESTASQVIQLETKYGVEKSKAEILNLKNQQKLNDRLSKTLRWALVTTAFLALLSISFLIYRARTNKKLFQIEQKHAQNAKIAYDQLKSTQSQLIQSEKMASLGELTAGIAHEIQNPLNFVNNFSEVSNEMIDEMNAELNKGDVKEARIITTEIKQNLEKINHHGKRASDIVKGMLQHSRGSSGVTESTDINALVDEYVRLAYHGSRAKDKSFNATIKTDFDEAIGKIDIVPQDIGRVVLNLIGNAFYAVNERKKVEGERFEPTVSASTKKTGDKILISVTDNGNGIPQKVVDKIFQPFFTTKPTGQGTGLGLSLAYDIVKAHGGEIKVETKEGEGSEFIIQLPVV
ncbi:MAG TPA: tetratricopeptide repeat protein [Agriterribacter sp.]|nr:tetratricopeptide repeat protein [Agriterribacter sp.]